MDDVIPPTDASSPVPSPTGDSSGYNANTFTQLADAAWGAMRLAQADPTTLNIQTELSTINNLDVYLTANPPPSGSQGAEVLSLLNQPSGFGNYTVGQLAGTYSSSNDDPEVIWLENENNNTTAFGSLYNYMNSNISSVYLNQTSNPAIKNDVTQMQLALSAYNADPSTANLVVLATAINQFNTDYTAANPPITDGYLTLLDTYINAPMVPGQSYSLVSLSSAVVNNPTNTTDLQELTIALQALGAGNNSIGNNDSFAQMLNFVVQWEYNNPNGQHIS